jgi:hypothetical protein
MSFALFSHGTQLQMGDAGTPIEAFAAVPLLGDIGYTEPIPSKIKYADQSDSSGYVKYIAGLKDNGKVSVKVVLNPSEPEHAMLWAAHGTIRNFRIVPPPNSSDQNWRQFPGLVSLAHNFMEDGAWEGTLTLDIMGAVVVET